MTRDPIDDTALATRLNESREDVFRDLQDPDSRLDSGEGIAFQEFDRRVSEKREQLSGALDDEGAAIAVLNDIDDRSDVTLRERDQRTVSTTTRDLFSARKYQEDERSREAIARDRATNAERVTGDFERWKQQPGQLDFPGVDTRGNIGPQLAGETSSAAQQEKQTKSGVTPMVRDESAAGFGEGYGTVGQELRSTAAGRAPQPVNVGQERADSMVADGMGGVSFDRNTGG